MTLHDTPCKYGNSRFSWWIPDYALHLLRKQKQRAMNTKINNELSELYQNSTARAAAYKIAMEVIMPTVTPIFEKNGVNVDEFMLDEAGFFKNGEGRERGCLAIGVKCLLTAEERQAIEAEAEEKVRGLLPENAFVECAIAAEGDRVFAMECEFSLQ